MFFKFFILLLSSILAANSVLGDSEDENEPDQTFEDKHVILEEDPENVILSDSYDDCRTWLGKSPNSTVSMGDFWLYMGKNQSDSYRINDYLIHNPAVLQGPIDLQLYGKLFKYICDKRGVTVKDWAAYRKNKAASRTLRETSLLHIGDHD